MHKLALKHKHSTRGFSLYLENLYPIPKIKSLLRNYLNSYYYFLNFLKIIIYHRSIY